MWDIVLNRDNVTALWDSCEKYYGNLVAWAQLQQYIHGDIVVIILDYKIDYSILDINYISYNLSLKL